MINIDFTICPYTGNRYLNRGNIGVGIKVGCSPSKSKPEINSEWIGMVLSIEGNRLTIGWDSGCISHYDLGWSIREEQPPFVIMG